MIFDSFEQQWRIWIGQRRYYIEQGYMFELRIKNMYFPALLEKDTDWFISINGEVSFTLHPYEVYKVRIQKEDYFLIPEAP
jgi:hypothetical protein